MKEVLNNARFSYGGETYNSINMVVKHLNTHENKDFCEGLLTAYRAFAPSAYGNLRYFMGGEPEWFIFKRFHIKSFELKQAQSKVQVLEEDIRRDYLNSKEVYANRNH